MTIRVGTRGSELARTQTGTICAELRARFPGRTIEEVEIRTTGDQDRDTPLHQQGSVGLFTGELERALLDDRIDVAVHSLKDLPTALDDRLVIAAVPQRASPWDVWISEKYASPADLPEGLAGGVRVMTGSLRRRAQLLHQWPQLEVHGIRGNIDTRLTSYREQGGDALILAAAGLARTGRSAVVRATFGPTELTPSPGQGALAVQARADDDERLALLRELDDPTTRAAVTAERAFLATLEAGCHMPVGAIAAVSGPHLSLLGMVALPDGTRLIRMSDEGRADAAESVGVALAESMLAAGAREILAELAREGRKDA